MTRAAPCVAILLAAGCRVDPRAAPPDAAIPAMPAASTGGGSTASTTALPGKTESRDGDASTSPRLTYVDRYGLTYRLPDTVEMLVMAGERPSVGLGTVFGTEFVPRWPVSSLSLDFDNLRVLCVVPLEHPETPLANCLDGDEKAEMVALAGHRMFVGPHQRIGVRVDAPTWNLLSAMAGRQRMVCLNAGRPYECF